MKEVLEILSLVLALLGIIASWVEKYDLAAFLVAMAIWVKL